MLNYVILTFASSSPSSSPPSIDTRGFVEITGKAAEDGTVQGGSYVALTTHPLLFWSTREHCKSVEFSSLIYRRVVGVPHQCPLSSVASDVRTFRRLILMTGTQISAQVSVRAHSCHSLPPQLLFFFFFPFLLVLFLKPASLAVDLLLCTNVHPLLLFPVPLSFSIFRRTSVDLGNYEQAVQILQKYPTPFTA